MLIKRVVTALIGIPIAVYIISFGGWLFALTVTLLAILAWHEYYSMLKHKQIHAHYWLGLVGIFLLQGCSWLGNSQETLMVLFAIMIVALAKAVVCSKEVKVTDSVFTVFGIIYIGLAFSYFLLLRFIESPIPFDTPFGTIAAGVLFLGLSFFGTWANDTFAFFVGSSLGRRKLCPAVSPGKTVEGALGGLLGSILLAILFGQILHLKIVHSVMLGLLIGVAAPLGDLAESILKRYTGVKDSGKLLPGHGGVLDRFDSVMFTVPVVYYYLHLILL